MILTLQTLLESRQVDWVISDMAPDMSGVDAVDQPRCMALAHQVMVFAAACLRGQGGLLMKAFQGEGFEEFLREMRTLFPSVTIRKPDASRSRSREVYLLGRPKKAKQTASRKKT